MFRRYLPVLIVFWPLFAGCGGGEQSTVSATTEVNAAALNSDGSVDEKLPPMLKAKQRAMATVLFNIREGARPESISQYVNGVIFSETSKQFFDGGVNLIRWKFNGTPKGNDIPVVLTIATKDGSNESDQAPKTVERTYSVTVKSGKLEITRK